MNILLHILYKLDLWGKITLIGVQNDGKTEIYRHYYTHTGMPNTGDYIVINEILHIVINKSFNYQNRKSTCWIIIQPIIQDKKITKK